ncbi:RagB/SusD family nutrient uptake outer membrane protein [Thermophagus sp. OGC60D27]|uniref:RagB/SusD family nutrient uptake outer membrane protein n=1 Tax=Thermophagus sp. OGC60D27 TaxID=3458415 RepID=UPI004038089C
MNKLIYIISVILALGYWGCDDDAFLDREPKDILLDEQVYSDNALALAVLADFYFRLPEFQGPNNWWNFVDFDEGFGSAFGDYWRHKNNGWDFGEWGMWDYGFIREINLFIEKAMEANEKELTQKARFIAEGRFIRAWLYFEMVKRMGGVPLITESMTYDFSGDPTYLQYPRAKEYEIYDFILSELDAIKGDLPSTADIKSRATQGLVDAMKSRVALYAGSIAKHGVNTPSVSLPGGEVGIPASMAEGYYEKALNAAEKLINDGPYSLYKAKEDLSENFANIFIEENNNPEVIFAKDFMQSEKGDGRSNAFTLVNQPWSVAEDLEGGRLNPSLNMVQSFELLDNTFQKFQTKDELGNWIFYEKPEDIFANRDPRLKGTVMIPGSKFKGKDLDIWAGYALPDGTLITGDQFGEYGEVPGLGNVQVVGMDGPIDRLEFSAQTGFYIRKHMDPATGSGQRGLKSEQWWVRYRLAEVYLNAAEAAFELGYNDVAAEYLNVVRRRAGFTIDLTEDEISFDRIVHERKVELAFEGHQLWDYKRWRIAHKVWNGEPIDHVPTDPGNATSVSTRVFGLWPYKYYDPENSNNPNNGKYVYKEILPSEVTGADRFQLGNYYSRIGDDILNNNPLIVKNPNHN